MLYLCLIRSPREERHRPHACLSPLTLIIWGVSSFLWKRGDADVGFMGDMGVFFWGWTSRLRVVVATSLVQRMNEHLHSRLRFLVIASVSRYRHFSCANWPVELYRLVKRVHHSVRGERLNVPIVNGERVTENWIETPWFNRYRIAR